MLNKRIFKKGLEKIQNAFDGFELTDRKMKTWYEYCKDLTDEKFLYRIKNCIKGCRRIPTLADILDWKNYFVNEKEEADIQAEKREKEWRKQKEKDKKEKFAPMPPKVKENWKKSLGIIEEKKKIVDG